MTLNLKLPRVWLGGLMGMMILFFRMMPFRSVTLALSLRTPLWKHTALQLLSITGLRYQYRKTGADGKKRLGIYERRDNRQIGDH